MDSNTHTIRTQLEKPKLKFWNCLHDPSILQNLCRLRSLAGYSLGCNWSCSAFSTAARNSWQMWELRSGKSPKKTPFRLLKKKTETWRGGVSKRKILQVVNVLWNLGSLLQMCEVRQVSFSIRFWMAVIRRVTAPCFSMMFMKISWQWHHRLLLLIGEEAVSARWRTTEKTGKLL